MSLTTRCPRCDTAFVLTPEQLRARDGLVRCGVCAAVFDARADVPDDKIPVLESVIDAPPSLPAVAREATPSPAPEPAPASLPAALPAVLRGRDGRAEPVLGTIESGADPHPHIVADPAVRISHYTGSHPPAHDADDDDDGFDNYPALDLDDEATLGQRARRALVTLAIVAALLALAAQALWVWRVQLVAAVPSLRPVLERLCQPLACTVGYARHIDRLVITASALQTEPVTHPSAQPGTPPGAPARLRLTATLQNRHTQPQHWPALMLELRDFSDTVVVRRALAPEEYLAPAALAQPLGPGVSIQLSVPLTVTGVKDINGYQIRPFYP